MAFEHYDKCSLLLPMDGANNGTTFTDWSPNPKTVTRSGDAKTVTAQSKYYGSSGYFDGNDGLSVTLSALGTGDFTIAFWCYRAGNPDGGAAFSSQIIDFRTGSNLNDLLIFVNATSDPSQRFVKYYAGADRIVSSSVLSNNWMHVALVRASNITRLFINGSQEGGNYADSNNFASTLASIGRRYEILSGSWYGLNGYLQDLLIIKGAALWTSNFTPPARLIGTISGEVRDKDNAPASRIVTAFPRTVPTKLYQTTSSAVDGTFSLRLPATESTALVMANESVMRNDIVDRIIPE